MINSLVMGFGLLGRRLEFLLIPVVLSIIALLLPPADLSLLMHRLETDLEQMQALTLETGPASGLASAPDTQSGVDTAMDSGLPVPGMDALLGGALPQTLLEAFPLEILLVNRMFFRVPGYISLLPMAETNSPWTALTVSSVGDLLLLVVGVFACGILMGALYLYRLGQQVRLHFQQFEASAASEEDLVLEENTAVPAAAGFWFRTGQMFLYFAFILMVWLGSALLLAIVFGIFSLAAPQAAVSLLSFLLVAYLLFIYYQTYVAAGVMMDGLTVWQAFRNSLQLVTRNFLSTLVFLFLAGFIMLGIELLLENLISLTQDHALGVLVASLIFAYVGTGVALAFLVFYRTRLLLQQGVDITQYFATQEN